MAETVVKPRKQDPKPGETVDQAEDQPRTHADLTVEERLNLLEDTIFGVGVRPTPADTEE